MTTKQGMFPGQVQLRVQLDSVLGGLVLRSRVQDKAHVDRRAVDRAQGGVESKPVPRCKGRGAVQDLVEQPLEDFQRPFVHCVGQRGFGHLPHPERYRRLMFTSSSCPIFRCEYFPVIWA